MATDSLSRHFEWPKLGSAEDADRTHQWARDCLLMWESERARLIGAIEEAGGLLSMTTCPYLIGDGKCDTGCYSEPRCVSDTPTEGWDGAALAVLNRALDGPVDA